MHPTVPWRLSARPVIDVGSQTETQWRFVGDYEDLTGDHVDAGLWTDAVDAVAQARSVASVAPPVYHAVYLERRSVTYGEPVRVELDERSGDAV